MCFHWLKPGLFQCCGPTDPFPCPQGSYKPQPPHGPSQRRGTQSAHQVDKILVADLPIRVTVSESQEHVPFVRVQRGAVALQEAAELACADVACVPWVKLKEKHRQAGGQRGSAPHSALPQVPHHHRHWPAPVPSPLPTEAQAASIRDASKAPMGNIQIGDGQPLTILEGPGDLHPLLPSGAWCVDKETEAQRG